MASIDNDDQVNELSVEHILNHDALIQATEFQAFERNIEECADEIGKKKLMKELDAVNLDPKHYDILLKKLNKKVFTSIANCNENKMIDYLLGQLSKKDEEIVTGRASLELNKQELELSNDQENEIQKLRKQIIGIKKENNDQELYKVQNAKLLKTLEAKNEEFNNLMKRHLKDVTAAETQIQKLRQENDELQNRDKVSQEIIQKLNDENENSKKRIDEMVWQHDADLEMVMGAKHQNEKNENELQKFKKKIDDFMETQNDTRPSTTEELSQLWTLAPRPQYERRRDNFVDTTFDQYHEEILIPAESFGKYCGYQYKKSQSNVESLDAAIENMKAVIQKKKKRRAIPQRNQHPVSWTIRQ